MDKLPIESVEIKVLEVPLKDQWQISYYAARTRRHLLVRIKAGDVVGYGEVSPSPGFMGEEAKQVGLVITEYLAPRLIGTNLFDVERIHQQMNEAIYGNGSAKSAVDIAVHDAIGKALQIPLYQYLGGLYRSKAPVTWVASIKDYSSVSEEIRQFLALGVTTFKLKVGKSPERDLEVLARVRSEFGTEIRIRIDANQGYSFDEAIKVLRRMEKFDIESIEQPVKAHDLDGMCRIAEALDTPVMADESLFYLHSAVEIARRRAADLFNIKIGKVGGLLPARKIAAVAEAAGIPCTVGSNLELSVGTAASVHFACSTPNVTYASDLAIGHYLHEYDIVKEPVCIDDGHVAAMQQHGLGVSLLDEYDCWS
ncbi:enolase C-terminal domain-like protein [Aeribacillus sp. FSL K6-8210]|uniref:mandelate racemase/muconate lactonizing enzyme family protein n=1 Tax=Aeribacillus sp. FSL K6-8210 TaxID=2954683 RepID=UPI0030CFAED4